MNKTNASLFGKELDNFLEQVKKDKEKTLAEMDNLYDKIFVLEKKQIHYQNVYEIMKEIIFDIFSRAFPDEKMINPIEDLEKIRKWIKEAYNDKL